MARKKKKQKAREIPFSWRIWQVAGCMSFGAMLFPVLYFNVLNGLYTSVGSVPDNTEKLIFSLGFACFFSIMIAACSNVILLRIRRKQSMTDIVETVAKEVASEALNAVFDGARSASGGSGSGSSGTAGGGGSFGGGGASGKY